MAIVGVLETCLYTHDLTAAEAFYAGALGLDVFSRETGRHVFFRCGEGMLLVFDPARTSTAPGEVAGVAVPAHGTEGAGHMAFRVPESELADWCARLQAGGIGIEAEIAWPGGGRSIYVRDPAGNSVELATGSVWGLESPDR